MESEGNKYCKREAQRWPNKNATKISSYSLQVAQISWSVFAACMYLHVSMHDCACIWSLPGQKCTCTGLATLTSASAEPKSQLSLR